MTKPAGIRQWVVVTSIMLMVLSVSGAGTASAQGFVSPFVGYNFGGDSGCPEITGCEDKNLNVGVAVGSLGNVFGVELEFAYANDFFGDIPGGSSSVLTVMGNALLAPRFGPAQPYGLLGIGLMKTNAELTPAGLLETSHNHLGWNVGGGMIVFFGRHVGVRGDIRYFHAFQDFELVGVTLGDIKLDYGRAAAGLVFRF